MNTKRKVRLMLLVMDIKILLYKVIKFIRGVI